MLSKSVYFVGLRYQHHARHSGYEQFGRHVGSFLPPPVNFRWTLGPVGWALNQFFAKITRHPWYSLGAHLTEWSAFQHMVRHRKSLYHILYGDSDLWLLRHAHRLTGNFMVASFHQPVNDLRELGAIERVGRKLDGAILVSEAQRSYFEEFLPAERVFVVPHGVDTEFFRPAPGTHDGPLCITVGSHLRDFETLRKAIGLVWESNPSVQFIAVGTRTSEKFYFRGLEDKRILYLDRVSDEELLQSLQKAKVALFSFASATANNAMLEAMASGLPIVATDVGGIGEYITDDVGTLCPPKNPDALAASVLHYLNDSESQMKKAKAARERALQLDFNIVAKSMSAIYSQILHLS
ncbi:MAG: glycosyltransferase family 4 protein [bacterium]|nr:glycosyltransferase family 4 protein [bacterium]